MEYSEKHQMAKAQGKAWHRLKALGSGGFGEVSLWENVHTHEKIAIKVCMQQKPKPKHLQRWRQEVNDDVNGLVSNIYVSSLCSQVEIMQSLNHPGLVQYHAVPHEIGASFGPTNVVLGMEFCERGDLRRVCLTMFYIYVNNI